MYTIKPQSLTPEDIVALNDFFCESKLNVWQPNTVYKTKAGVEFKFEHLVVYRYSNTAEADKYDFISTEPVAHGSLPKASKLFGTLTINEDLTYRFNGQKNWFFCDASRFTDEIKSTAEIAGKIYVVNKPSYGFDLIDILFEQCIPLSDIQRLELCFLIIETFQHQIVTKKIVHKELTPMNIYVAFTKDEGMKVHLHNVQPEKPKLDLYYAAPELIAARQLPSDNISNLYSLARILALLLGAKTTTYQNLNRDMMLKISPETKLDDLFYGIACLSDAQKTIIYDALLLALNPLPSARGTFESFFAAFDSLYPFVVPSQLSENDSKKLFKLLAIDGRHIWRCHEIFSVDGVFFRVNRPIVKRNCTSRKHLGQVRYECMETQPFTSGGLGQITDIQGTLTLENEQCQFSADKPRVVKDVNFQARHPMLFANMRAKALHAKPPVIFKRHHMQVMKKIDGPDLFDILVTSRSRNSLSVNFALKLAKNIILAYRTQVYDLDLYHLDIKPENIKVKLMPGDNIEVTFLDFDFSIIIGQYCDTLNGTEGYVAPEILNLPGNIDFKPTLQSEIYSLGIVFTYLFDCVVDADRNAYLAIQDLLTAMTNINPHKRPKTLDKILAFVDKLISDTTPTIATTSPSC